MKRRAMVVLGALATVLLASACGTAGATTATGGTNGPVIMVTGTDAMRFSPDTIQAKAGQPVTIAFKNAGLIPHDLITEGATRNVRLVNVLPGKEQSGTFLAQQPGEYTFYCSQPGHREAGMVGKIVVSP